MAGRTYTPRVDVPSCRFAHTKRKGFMPPTEPRAVVDPTKTLTTSPPTVYRLVKDEPLVEMTTVKLRGITLLWMSIVVTLFVNIIFGAFALVCSFRAHRLLRWPAPPPPPQQQQMAAAVEPDCWRVPLGHLQAARRLGRAAFVLNAAGILTSMLSLIFVFMYFGTQPEARKSLLSVLQSFMQPSAVNHPALEKGSPT